MRKKKWDVEKGRRKMINVRYARMEDEEFWYRLDKHLSKAEFKNKIRDQRGYIISEDDRPAGLLRYNLFWDSIPFCTLLFIEQESQGRGYGRALMEHWERDMKRLGCGMLLVSTQVDENAQHFYRKLGYKDCGGLVVDIPGYEQPMEMFLAKAVL